MSRAGAAVALVVLCTCLVTACAQGITPPTATEMAIVDKGLAFQFGLGLDGCDVPTDDECKDDDKQFNEGSPEVMVALKPFAIDVHEVTNLQYRYCVAMGACSLNAGDNTNNILDYYINDKYAHHPVVQVTALQAAEYCAFVDRRLPTEFEWERVAGGGAQSTADKRVYPFGASGPRESPVDCRDKDINLYNCLVDDRPRAVRASADDVVDVAGTKVWDLFGNVWEWTSSLDNAKASCDNSAPYTCGECVDCLGKFKKDDCAPKCQDCECGTGDPSTKLNCYKPCDTPICPVFPAAKLPLDPATITSLSTDQQIIRGGSFHKGSGQKDNYPCHGRSDTRNFTWRKAEQHTALGIRCARSL